jgi:hypothetical protein
LKALTWFEGGDLDALAEHDRAVLVRAAAAVRDLPRVAVRSHSLAMTGSARSPQ